LKKKRKKGNAKMVGIKLRIKENLEDFNPTERKIAAYILERAEDILKLSIAQLADQTGSSQAAIVRFFKKLGFAGFKDIKKNLTHELIGSNKESFDNEGYSDIKAGDSPRKIISKVAENHIRAIEETVKVLDINAFRRAVAILTRAKRVDVFGCGASGLVAQDLQQKFVRIGKYCLAYTDVHLQLTAAASLTGDDAAVFISYSGKPKDIISCLHLVQKQGVPAIAITKYGSAPLAKQADIVLSVCSPEIMLRSGAMSSRITQLAVVDMLFTDVAGQNFERSQELLQYSHDSVAEKRYK
jgi:DNA-binding MurR/RpiR family transcriptional regulator